ncbi:hypothetical protein DSL72_000273 [Monilinia vaccinii-corymbosi]|uniref:F-box domain-containing protein n=1 Tax=Monilinia vaccinii-corymbosi TaxID=61207 RepID=A0A8A3NYG8_9HELO|nr:hypothetical protein DSL72_000273 [Monilinia vaccinii-corymbosi]
MSTAMDTSPQLQTLDKKRQRLSNSEEPETTPENTTEDNSMAHKHMKMSPPITTRKAPCALPDEIWLQVLGLLPTKDVKNFRLCSKKHAEVGSEHFIQAFEFRSSRLDLERRETISRKHPRALSNVKKIRFETGFIAFRSMFSNLMAKSDSLHPENEEANFVCDMTLEYLAWYKSWHRAAQKYDDIPRITEAFDGMKNADFIHISSRPPQFVSDTLIYAWLGSLYTKDSRAQLIINEFTSIMQAAHDSKIKLRHLAHDSMPVEFFTQEPSVVANLLKPFIGLESLYLTCYVAHKSTRQYGAWEFWIGIFKTLMLAPGLKTLHLGIENNKYGNVYVPLRKVLGNFTWPSLNRLRLDGVSLCEADLTSFLLRHAASLRHLTLSNMILFTGSFEGLFNSLRSGLSLETFHLSGSMVCQDVKSERWYFTFKEEEITESLGPVGDNDVHEKRFLRIKDKYEIDRLPKWWKINQHGLADDLQNELLAFVLNKDTASTWPLETITQIADLEGRPWGLLRALVYSAQVIDRAWDDHFLGWTAVAHDLPAWGANDLPEARYWRNDDEEMLLETIRRPFWSAGNRRAEQHLMDMITPLLEEVAPYEDSD